MRRSRWRPEPGSARPMARHCQGTDNVNDSSPAANAAARIPIASDRDRTRAGLASALGAYGIWGVAPIYFKAVGHVPVLEILAHRVLWSLVFVAGLLTAQGRWAELGRALQSRRTLATFAVTTALIAGNWGIFIWAIVAGRVLEVSLGYFINPLMSVVLGLAVLGERLRPRQWLAVGLAVAAVANQTVAVGAPPWMGLWLAGSFAVYGLLRKTARAESLTGLAIETGLLAPIALAYLVWLGADGAFLLRDRITDLLLLAAGPVTALPLLFFAHAARRLRLATVGLLQYLAPSIQFVMAVLWWREPFTSAHLVTFALIWVALAVYTWESLRRA